MKTNFIILEIICILSLVVVVTAWSGHLNYEVAQRNIKVKVETEALFEDLSLVVQKDGDNNTIAILNPSNNDLNMKHSVSGLTLLMYATKCANLAMIKFLLNEGANKGETDNNGDTAYNYSLQLKPGSGHSVISPPLFIHSNQESVSPEAIKEIQNLLRPCN